MGINKCIHHQDDLNLVCLPWTECSSPHCEYCGNIKCSEIGDGIVVCNRCEAVLKKHLMLSTGDCTQQDLDKIENERIK